MRGYRLRTGILLFSALFLSMLLLLVTPALSETLRISGSVFYRERIALPPNYVLLVRLVDYARQDAAAPAIAEVELMPARQAPIPFLLEVNKDVLEPRGRYSLAARIFVDGRLRFTTDRINPVRPDAQKQSHNLLLRQVGGPKEPL
jgi:putative lipoprotein